jgi:hypothetical protein
VRSTATTVGKPASKAWSQQADRKQKAGTAWLINKHCCNNGSSRQFQATDGRTCVLPLVHFGFIAVPSKRCHANTCAPPMPVNIFKAHVCTHQICLKVVHQGCGHDGGGHWTAGSSCGDSSTNDTMTPWQFRACKTLALAQPTQQVPGRPCRSPAL